MPEIRNRLVFQKNPLTFNDLDELCIQQNEVNMYNDYVTVTLGNTLYVKQKVGAKMFQMLITKLTVEV